MAIIFLFSAYAQITTAYVSGMNPGVLLRLEQRTINEFKDAMEAFFPHYFNEEENHLPSDYEWTLNFLFNMFHIHFKWSKISYSAAEFDIHDTRISFVTLEDDQNALEVKFPALEHWQIDAF